METVVDEIRNATEALGFSAAEIRLLPAEEAAAVIVAVLQRFVASGDRRWWWEDFRADGASVRFSAGDGWRQVEQVVPDADEKVWFIAEEDQLDHYPVYETTTRNAVAILGECYGFEFYLVPKDLSWLVCETHHDVVVAIGDAVESRLLDIDAGP